MAHPGLYLVAVWFRAKPQHAEPFARAMAENAKASVEKEPGCHLFEVRPDGDGLALYEVYESRAAFDDHLASRHYLDFVEQTKDWVADKKVGTGDWQPFAGTPLGAIVA